MTRIGRLCGFLVTTMAVIGCLLPGLSFAQADAGNFMGYRLGTDYKIKDSTKLRLRTDGSIVVIADDPFKPDDIAEVSLIVTPETMTSPFRKCAIRSATCAGKPAQPSDGMRTIRRGKMTGSPQSSS